MHKFIEQVGIGEGSKGSLLYGDHQDFARSNEDEEGFDREFWGRVKCVEQYGGEGKGDSIWAVYEVDGEHFRVNGWYASYDGASYDDVEKVVAKPVVKNEWERVC
jgi:hypothetical protein